MQNTNLLPFVKWAGGKRQLLDRIKERLPLKYNNYFEPFVGGGAVLFGLKPEKAIINDINASLINAYKVIAHNTQDFLEYINTLDNGMWEDGKAYYYTLRERYNDKIMQEEYDVEMAALFVFINKHCFNGLYRVNGKGLFNVPYNNSRRSSIDSNLIVNLSGYLKNIQIMQGDFENVCQNAARHDFVFF